MRALLLLVLLLPLSSCGSTSSIGTIGGESGQTRIIVGTVRLVPVLRGCWQFEDDEGNTFELVGDIARELFTDGLRARIAVRSVTGLSSVCQVGTLVEVMNILEVQE